MGLGCEGRAGEGRARGACAASSPLGGLGRPLRPPAPRAIPTHPPQVQCAEGFSKAALFDVLGPLEARSRPIMARAAAALKAAKGEDAAQPWNRGYALAGQSEAAMDPYFQFEDAVGVWARSFAGEECGGIECRAVGAEEVLPSILLATFPPAVAPNHTQTIPHSHSALGISFAGSTMRLDLLDRPEGNKYPNGFCHWPGVAWIR